MAKHYGIKADGFHIETRLTLRHIIGRALRHSAEWVVWKMKVWLGWRIR